MESGEEGSSAKEDGGVPDRLKGEVSPEGWAAYKRITAMSQEEYLEMSNRHSDERIIKDILEEIP